MTENYLLDMETSTLASSIELIAPSLDTSRNTLLTMPHKVGTSISEVPSPAHLNLTNFRDDDAQDHGYNSDGKIGPFFDALEEGGEQYYDEEYKIPEQYYGFRGKYSC